MIRELLSGKTTESAGKAASDRMMGGRPLTASSCPRGIRNPERSWKGVV